MPNIKINIIHSSLGIVEIKPDLSKLSVKIERSEDYYDSRLTLGEITVFGKDYEKIITHNERLITFFYFRNGIFEATGTMDLFYKKDISFKKISLKLVVEDKYTVFDKEKSTFFNMLEVPKNYWFDGLIPIPLAVFDNTDVETFVFTFPDNAGPTYPYIFYSIATDPANLDETGYPVLDELNKFYPDLIEGMSYTNSSWGIFSMNAQYYEPLGAFTFIHQLVFKRVFGYGYFEGGIAQPPSDGTWYYIGDVFINNVRVPKFAQPYPKTTWTETETPHVIILYQSNFIVNSVTAYSNWRFFQDVFRFLINKISPAVLFDSDSFKYLNEKTGETCTEIKPFGNSPHPSFSSNYPFKDLIIMSLPAFIPNSDGSEKENEGTLAKINLVNFWEFFKQRNFVWFIDENNYFRMKHFTELSESVQGIYLNSFNRNQVEYDNIEYSIIHNSESSASIEFRGLDVRILNTNVTEKMDWGQQVIKTDIDDIRIQKDAAYNGLDNEGLVIISAMFDEVNNVAFVRRPNGKILSNPKNNCELAWSYVCSEQLSELPVNTVNINGFDTVISDNRLSKSRKTKLDCFVLPFDFKKYITFAINEAEIQSLEYNAMNNKAELTLKY